MTLLVINILFVKNFLFLRRSILGIIVRIILVHVLLRLLLMLRKIQMTGINSNRLEVIGVDIDKQSIIYEQQLIDVYNNPRWYLDNLEYLTTYRVSWIDYKKVKITPLYHKRVTKRKIYK